MDFWGLGSHLLIRMTNFVWLWASLETPFLPLAQCLLMAGGRLRFRIKNLDLIRCTQGRTACWRTVADFWPVVPQAKWYILLVCWELQSPGILEKCRKGWETQEGSISINHVLDLRAPWKTLPPFLAASLRTMKKCGSLICSYFSLGNREALLEK